MKRLRDLGLLVAMLVATGAGVAAAETPVRVSSEAMPDTVLIGQLLTLRWRMWLPQGSQVNFPARPADDSTSHWRGWQTATLDVAKGGLREHRLTAELQSFALGPVSVPGPPVRFRIPGEEVREGRFPTVGFFVGSTVPRSGPEPPLRDMKALVPPPWWALVPWVWVAVGLAVLALLTWLYLRWRSARRRGPAEVSPVGAWETPESEARRRLAALIARGLPEQGRTLEHGTELADILRRFVERRFETPRPGYTTSELVRHLLARGDVAPGDVVLLQSILEACDLTKFARRPYDAARAHEAETIAAMLIDIWARPEPKALPGAEVPPAAATGKAGGGAP